MGAGSRKGGVYVRRSINLPVPGLKVRLTLKVSRRRPPPHAATKGTPLDVVRHRLIDVHSMDKNLRLFVKVAFALLGVSALVLAAQALPLPRPTTPVDVGPGRPLEVPVVSLVLAI